jgi:two-component system chemotaxis sensor kinase CheA
MDMSKYKGMFVSETTEHLQSMNQGLLTIERDHANKDAISEVFRNAHSIKGMAASMGFETIRDLAHAMEDLMDDFRKGVRDPEPATMDLLFKGADTLEANIQDVAADREPSTQGAVLSGKIRSFREQNPAGGGAEDGAVGRAEGRAQKQAEPGALAKPEDSAPPPAPPSAPEPPAAPAPSAPAAAPAPATGAGANRLLRVIFSAKTTSPGVRGLILFKRLGEVGQILSSRPAADEVKAGKFLPDPRGLAVEIDFLAEASEGEIVKVINSLTDVQAFELQSRAAAVFPPEEKKPEGEAAEAAARESGKIESAYDPFASALPLPQTVRVKTSALDRFIGALGEMILVKSELREVAKRNPIPALETGINKLEALVKDFHDQVMAIRMMPLEGVVQRLPRVVRDLAKEEGKKIRFEVRGQEIELDRAILEELTDPLIHLLRNCVNHGIEPPEERVRGGKPAEGKIELEAYRLRDLVLIEVRDDGRGMDPFLLREAAVAKAVLTSEEAAALSDEDAIQLIFRPGFSTAKAVGMVSGRGVGMDAVKTVVEGVGGYVTVVSKPYAGTTFTLHLPRTIAIVNVLLVKLAREIFAIPITKIQKTVEILAHQVRKSQGQPFFLDRQEMVPLDRQEMIPMKPLHRFLDLPEPERDPRAPRLALIVAAHNRKVALLVDDLVGQEEAFIRPLGKPLERVSGLSGVTMLGDGRLVFVLEIMSLL